MIPKGYWTVPGVLHYISMRDDLGEWAGTHERAVNWVWAAMADGELSVFVLNGMSAGRLAYEDVREMLDNGEKAPAWFASGKVPQPEWDTGQFDDMPRPRRPLTLLEQYRGLKLLIEVDNLKRWLASWRSGKPTIARTGAPGGPSSMGIVMAEFEQRRASGRCESSREAEANILAAWLKETHPAMPPLKAKSIRNKLPPDFQPFSHCPKL